MSSNQAPSAGVKVTSNPAPTRREGAGAVAPDSLAAESSTFTSSNRNAAPGSGPTQTSGKVSAPGEGGVNAGSSGSLENQASYAGAAPSYVNRQFQAGEGGPKGKDLREVESFESGVKDGREAAFGAEPGSELDPGRAAEAGFGLRGEGGRKANEGDSGETGQRRFGALDSETSA
ncbi:hypothetical protein BR93DRAFT_932293 [Coniochaeta sp. PMI_546]|nr:hypothetical protein BR93DRAFT_932293 [Coniochaeta sp. PMI_546]